jgi:hypothetical protein
MALQEWHQSVVSYRRPLTTNDFILMTFWSARKEEKNCLVNIVQVKTGSSEAKQIMALQKNSACVYIMNHI